MKNIEKVVIQILANYRDGLTFEELREILEYSGYYIDGLTLRKIIANLIHSNIIYKIPSEKRKKFLLTLYRVDK